MKKAPLAGIRVIEHGQLLAVPYCARMLCDLGAEVIKVESPLRLDSHRQTTYPDNVPGDRFWDRGGTFHSENRGKLGVTLDLRDPAAIQAFRDLAAISDVIVENFTPRVMKAFSLGYDDLKKLRPDIVFMSSTGYGHTGPWANFRAVGPTTESGSGIAMTTGYEGGGPVLADIPYTDYIAAEQNVLAVMLALFRRKRTGKGCWIDMSQVEAQANEGGELFMEAALRGIQHVPHGNRHGAMAPHGFFPCAGDDRWIAIAVASDDEWKGLQAAMGNPSWAADARFETLAGRLANVEELEEKLGAWTRDRGHMELQQMLQAHGVPAGAAYDARDLLFDEQLKARRFWEWADHPEGTDIDTKPYPSAPWRFSQSARSTTRGAPGLGQHNDYVMMDLLGYSREKVDEMVASGALGGSPSDFPLPRPVPLQTLVQQQRAREIDPDYRERLRELHSEHTISA